MVEARAYLAAEITVRLNDAEWAASKTNSSNSGQSNALA